MLQDVVNRKARKIADANSGPSSITINIAKQTMIDQGLLPKGDADYADYALESLKQLLQSKLRESYPMARLRIRVHQSERMATAVYVRVGGELLIERLDAPNGENDNMACRIHHEILSLVDMNASEFCR